MPFVDIDKESLPVISGFRFAGVAAGIKKNGRPDLGLIVADEGTRGAAVLTTNLVRAAPVELVEKRMKGKGVRALLVNAGNANACTGKPGMQAAIATTRALATKLGLKADEVWPASTGVIGAVLPADKVIAGLEPALAQLSEGGAANFARAIMTTDQWPKVAVAEVPLGRGKVGRILGIAKGAGMIHPNMATTLGFVVTDLGASAAVLRKALKQAADVTFNALSVDGDTSTNDTIALLASGHAGDIGKGPLHARFVAALTEVLGALGESIVRDGEGARHVVKIEVVGTRTDQGASTIARTIATSPLVKTAIHGRDANWGRILAAAGRAGVDFDPAKARIAIGDVEIVKNGGPLGAAAEARAAKVMATERYDIRVTLGSGKGRAHYLTCDLGPDYVAVNANYRS